jgi:hypothetical protein
MTGKSFARSPNSSTPYCRERDTFGSALPQPVSSSGFIRCRQGRRRCGGSGRRGCTHRWPVSSSCLRAVHPSCSVARCWLKSALLGAGSLDQRLVKTLRARPSVAHRYLAIEGRRRSPNSRGNCRSRRSFSPRADRPRRAAMTPSHSLRAAPRSMIHRNGSVSYDPHGYWHHPLDRERAPRRGIRCCNPIRTTRPETTTTRNLKRARSSSCSKTRF